MDEGVDASTLPPLLSEKSSPATDDRRSPDRETLARWHSCGQTGEFLYLLIVSTVGLTVERTDVPTPLLPPPEEPPPVAGVKRPVDDETKSSAQIKDHDGNTIVRSRSPRRRSRSKSPGSDSSESRMPTWTYRLKKFKAVALDALVTLSFSSAATETHCHFSC